MLLVLLDRLANLRSMGYFVGVVVEVLLPIEDG